MFEKRKRAGWGGHIIRKPSQTAPESCQLRIVAPGDWSVVWRQSLQQAEQGLCIAAVHLRDARSGASVPLLAVGAGFVAGEDYPCGGRVSLVELRRDGQGAWTPRLAYSRCRARVLLLVMPEGVKGRGAVVVEKVLPEQDRFCDGHLFFVLLHPFGRQAVRHRPHTSAPHRLLRREFKGAVTALEVVDGSLLVATGNRLELCMLAVQDSQDQGSGRSYGLQRCGEVARVGMQSRDSMGPWVSTGFGGALHWEEGQAWCGNICCSKQGRDGGHERVWGWV
jgi:hypothetical protein